jgi:hypothetical protein
VKIFVLELKVSGVSLTATALSLAFGDSWAKIFMEKRIVKIKRDIFFLIGSCYLISTCENGVLPDSFSFRFAKSGKEKEPD